VSFRGVAPMKTMSQKYLERAAGRVAGAEGKEWSKIYGGLCHSFPVLVRTAGLAQAVAYHTSKAAGSSGGGARKCAHARIIEDYKDLLPNFNIEEAELREYMAATRSVLAAWIFYKRFAVSILKAEGANVADDGQGGE